MTETKIRLLVSDVDGTMVRHDKSLPEENVAAIRDLRARGLPVALISARPPEGIVGIASRLGLKGPLGAFNGGIIFEAEGRELVTHRVPQVTARALMDIYARPKVTTWLFAGGAWLTSDIENHRTPREIISSGLQPRALADFAPWLGQVDKVVAVCDDDDVMDVIEKIAREMAGVTATVVRSQDYYLDATAPQANKGDGVAKLAELYGVPLDAVAVIGDQANDIAMFRRAGLAIAMGQAKPAVQAAAHLIAASNEGAGVADAIARFILPRL
ncbi:HAD family hydrolase [Novosphingobium aquiterrae]|uniref:HAD family hydrolase n=1 Tax=Novosphingobium aquiterrae TaxID=624388 RepID=A0ABV6PLX7_9SPHN